jgi:hypothetical protein
LPSVFSFVAMIDDGYKLPPDATATKIARAQDQARRDHEPAVLAAAKRDQQAAMRRERPARPEATPAVRRALRERARVEADLKFRLRAIHASQEACVETKRAAQDRRRALDPELQMIRRDAGRSRDPHFADRWRAALERIESEAAELDELSAAMIEEQNQLGERSKEIIAVLTPLSALIDSACKRLGRTRVEIGAAIESDPYRDRRDRADLTIGDGT